MRLTVQQHNLIATFGRWDICRLIRFADHVSKTVHYALQFWNADGKMHYKYPNPRTVEALIKKGAFTYTDNDVLELNPEFERQSD